MSQSSDASARELAKWGEETVSRIERDFRIPNSDLYLEAYSPAGKEDAVAFNWSVGVWLSALNAASQWDPKYKPELRRFADATRGYWNLTPPVAGYDVLPKATSVDRYYDDNAWMVMALAQTSQILVDRHYLQWAEDGLKFCLSGEDDKLGGGVYWRENGKTSKNTCSNGPVAAACLAVYERNHDRALLTEAERIYDWTKRTLQDPKDHLFWDSISISNGQIGKMKWTYNTALMIRTATDLYKITKKRSYLEDARQMVQSSKAHWLGPDRALADDGPFAHLLLEGWTRFDVAAGRRAAEDVRRPLEFLHEHALSDGFYGKRWDRPPGQDQRKFQLIDQAAAARGYFEGALFLSGR